MPRINPALRSTETFTEPNFLRLQTVGTDGTAQRVTLEHFAYSATDTPRRGWSCLTIVDDETMSHDDAIFIAENYAAEHNVPVIYASLTD
jgi:hypothetical protein